MKIFLKKTLAGFIPADEKAQKALKRLKQGDVVSCEIKKPRKYKFHKKAFALFNLVFENQEKYDTLEDLLVEYKLRTGHYREHITSKGDLIYVPK